MMNAAYKCPNYEQEARTLVVGLGQTGLSVVRYLVKRGQSVSVVDSREAPPMLEELNNIDADIEVLLGDFKPSFFCTFQNVILSPGISRSEEAVQAVISAGADVVGDVELYARNCIVPVIAITGSNGKSTVTKLVVEMLNAAGKRAIAGGNIGVPVLDLLDRVNDQWHVLELSSFQLESTESLCPKSAVVLNISADHMDRYTGLEDYISAKQKIYKHTENIVINLQEPYLLPTRDEEDVTGFGLGYNPIDGQFGICNYNNSIWLCRGTTPLINTSDIYLQGEHNWLNILAGMALIESAGISLETRMLDAAKKCIGLPHRMELIRTRFGVRWINDSKGTNVGATVAALAGLNLPVVLIAGGQAKDANLKLLTTACAANVKHVCLIGEDAEKFHVALTNIVPLSHCDSLQDAVNISEQLSEPGEVVLFSPACASFDMFRNFEHRGDVFRQYVLELSE